MKQGINIKLAYTHYIAQWSDEYCKFTQIHVCHITYRLSRIAICFACKAQIYRSWVTQWLTHLLISALLWRNRCLKYELFQPSLTGRQRSMHALLSLFSLHTKWLINNRQTISAMWLRAPLTLQQIQAKMLHDNLFVPKAFHKRRLS